MDKLKRLYNYLKKNNDKKILFLTTSNRWEGEKVIERLTWLENRHTTLSESNLLKDKEVVVVVIGHNWNGEVAIKTEKDVLGFFGFKTPSQLSFNWQFTKDINDESKTGYKAEYDKFLKEFSFTETLNESLIRFKEWIKIK